MEVLRESPQCPVHITCLKCSFYHKIKILRNDWLEERGRSYPKQCFSLGAFLSFLVTKEGTISLLFTVPCALILVLTSSPLPNYYNQ